MVLDAMAMLAQYGWLGLLVVTFLSGSILPLPSDPAIVAALKFMRPEWVLLISVVGGTLGSITNYFIGSWGIHNLWFHRVKRDYKDEKKAKHIFDKYGYYAIVVAPSIPFIGDPLMIVAGAIRPNFKKFVLAIVVGRILKGLVLIYFGTLLFQYIGAG